MTIYYQNEVAVQVHEAVWIFAPEPRLAISITLLEKYGDGSGRIGQKLFTLYPQQLQADGGLAEIIAACNPFLEKQLGKENVMTTVPHKDHENKSLSELADLYNSMVPKASRITKFRDKPTALKRIADIFTKEEPKYASMKHPSMRLDGGAKKRDLNLNKDIKLSEGRSLKVDLTVTKGKMLSGGALQTHSEMRNMLRGRKSIYSGKYVYKTEKWKNANPRRPGTHGHHDWENYIRDGITYEQYIASGGAGRHLEHALKKNFIVLETSPR